MRIKFSTSTTLKAVFLKAAFLSGSMTLMAACLQTTSPVIIDAIEYRQTRFDEIAIQRAFDICVDEAMTLDQQARNNKSPGQYLASAKMLQTCESDIGSDVTSVDMQNRMRSYGLSIQNFLKGGDIAKAQHSLESFQTAFVAKDLYYPDGSSFIEAMSSLLGHEDEKSFGRFSMLNVSKNLKQEMRRKTYWRSN